jgi:hypothetical protein
METEYDDNLDDEERAEQETQRMLDESTYWDGKDTEE